MEKLVLKENQIPLQFLMTKVANKPHFKHMCNTVNWWFHLSSKFYFMF